MARYKKQGYNSMKQYIKQFLFTWFENYLRRKIARLERSIEKHKRKLNDR